MITSATNQRVKQVIQWQTKARQRRIDNVYLVEGRKMFSEAPENQIREVYVWDEALEKLKNSDCDTYNKLQRVGFEKITYDILKKMSDTQTPQGIITVLNRPVYSIDDMVGGENPLLVLLENLQDPGNMGTIIRTGEGAGITGVIMSADTVDIYNPKVIRATMGSIYRVPFIYVEDIRATIKDLNSKGICTYAAHLKGETYYDGVSFKKPTAFIIGNEGSGLTEETAELAMSYIKIPMEGKVESLNAAIATSLLIYEAHRQRNMNQQPC